MKPLMITARTLVSALGTGLAATLAALRARQSGLRPCDFADIRHGYIGRVEAVEETVFPPALARFACRNNALAAMALATDGFAEALARARARYGPERIAVVVGTSTSGVLATEEAYRQRDSASGALPATFDFEHTHELGSLARFVRAALRLSGPALTLSTACASSARAFVDAAYLLAAGVADAAVVGGADSLCRLTLRGFSALELVSPRPCRPCDAKRDGLSIGEAAGFVLLERAFAGQRSCPVALFGCGTSSDGHHLSAPHPEGAGAILAMQAALQSARLRPSSIDYINLHGTGTVANDAMEDKAVFAVFGDQVPVSSTKGFTGHTLGAAGIVEAIITTLAIEHGFLPGCLNVSEVDPFFRAEVLTENRNTEVRYALSNSFGFGGSNCSLIFGLAPSERA
jgi:3-oxoacyl-[acyl-carrier-protein] synthase-1